MSDSDSRQQNEVIYSTLKRLNNQKESLNYELRQQFKDNNKDLDVDKYSINNISGK